jgi:hypothetical protein
LLEGIRGRRNIHLLYRDDKVISLRRLLLDICHHGAVDIATLSLAARHLLPARPWIDPELEEHISGTTGAEREARIKDFEDVVRESSFTRWGEMNERGFVHIDEAGSLLSHRQASRPGDDVVIWSLLLGDQAFYNAQGFWLNRLNPLLPRPEDSELVNTGFLVSHAPRIKGVNGLSWAPLTPSLHRTSHASSNKYFAHDSWSERGAMSKEGLKALWLVYELPEEGSLVNNGKYGALTLTHADATP